MTSHYKTENGVRIYDLGKSITFLENMGKKHYGNQFKIYPQDRSIVYKLLVYAIRDDENCKKHNIDPNKGILLTGPVGCGKTTLINLIKYFLPADQGHIIKTSRDIVFEYKTYGHQIIQRHGQSKAVFCFDDLGVEQRVKQYGNTCNVMAEILLSRYDLFTSKKTKTHATTNLNASELEHLYGNRVRSRLREMFNLIAFDKGTGDKRK